MDSVNGLVAFFKATSDVLTAGLAVMTFSLFLYSLTFKIRDRLTNIFSAILFFLILVYGADAFGSVITDKNTLLQISKVHWTGLIFLPTLCFQFSDALLTLTGKPSKGKRKFIGYVMTVCSFVLVYLLFSDRLLGELIVDKAPALFFYRTAAMNGYIVFFFFTIALSVYNFFRAIRRTNSPTSKRRMIYLVVGALGLLLGLFPYLTFESSLQVFSSLTFWFLSTVLYLANWLLISIMTYAISFFGFSVPDREIKKRLFHWIFRGPLTASITLGLTTLIRRAGVLLGKDFAIYEILTMVASIVLLEHICTLFFPKMEKMLFRGKDLEELERVRRLEERLFTKNDFRQFSEIILANICDRIRVTDAVLFLKMNGSYDQVISIGNTNLIEEKVKETKKEIPRDFEGKLIVRWNGLRLIPIISFPTEENKPSHLGFIAISGEKRLDLDYEQIAALNLLLNRLRTAIMDYQQQQQMLIALDVMAPEMDEIQNLLAIGRFSDMNVTIDLQDSELINKWTKDALSHLWGGPKLTGNSLLQLAIVQKRSEESGDTLTKALRLVLQNIIESLKPEGERQYTNEWLLYNILDLKYNENMKMRDIAKRLSLSEADLYRKQRIAIEMVAKKIIEMETSYLLNPR
ncbi:MAG TPA: hypothetical protein DCK95_07630 [Anaerolineaceae bacterium]|uniref:Putative membrane protein n=1 Tax=Anaerolinea thermophila TaxID=167964 RepID=A0A117LGX7_9CHLR|nr:MAG: putative membrane protein [Anaerolinea thermophila]HAF62179.1 hypothetical protein [Anaerolineaceae bacterium]